MNAKREIAEIMKAHGFEVVRRGKHLVWADARGRRIVTAVSPSDVRAVKNIRAMVERMAG